MRIKLKKTLITICVMWTVLSWIWLLFYGFYCCKLPDREPCKQSQNDHLVPKMEKDLQGLYQPMFSLSALLHHVKSNLEKLWQDLDSFGEDIDTSNTELLKGNVHTVLKLFQTLEVKIQGNPALHSQQTSDQRNRKYNYSCPDFYKGTTHGYPFYNKGFERSNCTKVNVSKTVTFLFLNVSQGRAVREKSIQKLARSLNFEYPEVKSIFILTTPPINQENLSKLISSQGPFDFLFYSDKESKNLLLSRLVYSLVTPFVVIFPYLTEIDKNFDLNRLLHVVASSKHDVFAVGGSNREYNTGHWDTGCVQSSLLNYHYQKRIGYYRSQDECLVCDLLQGPILTRVSTLRKFPLNGNLGAGMLEDWFLRMKHQHLLPGVAMSCPDVMFTQTKRIVRDQELEKFAKLWDIRKMTEPDNQVRTFRCHLRDNINENICELRQGMTVPPCCLHRLANAVKFFMQVCKRRNISCEFQEGTMLGAVKFSHVLPWERYADLTFLTADFDQLLQAKVDFLLAGYDITVEAYPWCCVDGIKAGGVFLITFDNWHLEAYGQHIMDSNEKRKRGETPTMIQFAGSWFPAPDNPGKYVRNRYGHEIYKHAEHWQTAKKSSGWETYQPGKFETCLVAGHHACLDQFPADGNLQFVSSFE